MSDLNTTLWYMLWHKSHKNCTGEYFLGDRFPLRVIKYHHSECNNPFVTFSCVKGMFSADIRNV